MSKGVRPEGGLMGYFPSPGKTFSEIFIPTQTAWTDDANPSVNYGNETVMRNGGNNTTCNRNALLKFAVGAIGFGSSVLRARLRLYCSGESANKGGRYSVRGLASDWTETGVTHLSTGYEAWAGGNINAPGNYDGAPASELVNYAPVDGSGAPNPYYKPGAWPVGDDWLNQWIELDVTGLVQNWVSGARENNGLVITCISKVPDPDNIIDEYYGYMDVRWHTRHNANAPQLLVAYIPGPLKPHAVLHQSGGADEISVAGLSGLLSAPQKVAVLNNAVQESTRPRLNFISAFNVADDAVNERANVSLAVKPHYAAQLGDVYGGAAAVAVDLSADGWIDMKGVRFPNSGLPMAKVELGSAGALFPPFGQKYGTMKMRFAFYPETTPAGNETVRFRVSAEVRGLSLISIFSTSWVRYNFHLERDIGIFGAQYALLTAAIDLHGWPPGQPQVWTLGFGRDANHANDTYPGSIVVLRPVLFWWENSSEYV